MRRKQLLFSKRDKSEKAIGTGDPDENPEGLLDVPNNNNEISQNNSKNKNQSKTGKNNEIENVSNEAFDSESVKKKNKKNLQEELEKLKQELIKERNDSISIVNDLNAEDEEKNIELKKLTTDFNKMIQQLKDYEKSIVIKPKIKPKSKTKSDTEIKREIKIAEAQIKIYGDKTSQYKDDYAFAQQKAKIEENKENNLNKKLSDLNSKIKELNDEIEYLKITANIHLGCRNENRKLIEKLANLNTAYRYELKKTNKYNYKKGEDVNEIHEENDQMDNKAKAEEDEKNILPKIKVLKFKVESLQKLEKKIIKKNRIGLNKSSDNGNAIKCYKRLNTEYSDNNRYIKEANLNIRRGKNNEIKIEENLFNENEEKIMEKVIPDNMYNSYKNKYNNILQQKSQIKERINTENNSKKNEKQLLAYKCEYKMMEIKNCKIDNLKLVVKSQKLRDKINNLNQQIKEVQKLLTKENKKLADKINDEKRINLYFQKMQESEE